MMTYTEYAILLARKEFEEINTFSLTTVFNLMNAGIDAAALEESFIAEKASEEEQ